MIKREYKIEVYYLVVRAFEFNHLVCICGVQFCLKKPSNRATKFKTKVKKMVYLHF